MFNIIKGLNRHFDFKVLTLQGKGDMDNEFRTIPVDIHHMPVGNSLSSPYSLSMIWGVLQYVKSVNPSIIHSWLYHPNLVGTVIKFLPPWPKPKLVVSKRGSNYWYKHKHFLANRLIYKGSDLIMVNSAGLQKEILKYCNVGSKIRIIPNGIDINFNTDNFEIPDYLLNLKSRNVFIVGSVGRFVKEKRYEDIIEAARIFSAKRSNVHFVFVGGRGEIDSYKKMVYEKGLQEMVTFTGEVKNTLPFIKGFDVFLLASSSEGMPNVIMEAMLLKKPVVATNVGAVPDVITDKLNGILVPPYRPDRLVEAIEFLMNEKDTAKQLAANGAERIRDFSIDAMLSNVEKMYNDVLVE